MSEFRTKVCRKMTYIGIAGLFRHLFLIYRSAPILQSD